jgi:hypothetical protein
MFILRSFLLGSSSEIESLTLRTFRCRGVIHHALTRVDVQ